MSSSCSRGILSMCSIIAESSNCATYWLIDWFVTQGNNFIRNRRWIRATFYLHGLCDGGAIFVGKSRFAVYLLLAHASTYEDERVVFVEQKRGKRWLLSLHSTLLLTVFWSFNVARVKLWEPDHQPPQREKWPARNKHHFIEWKFQ